MDTGELLLAAIREHPAEDTPRLEYADWLDERGRGNDHARGEFIRVQVELAGLKDSHSGLGATRDNLTNLQNVYRMPRNAVPKCDCRHCVLRRREAELWPPQRVNVLRLGRGLNELRYTVGLPGGDRPCKFRRGFLDEVRLPLDHFLLHARDMFARHPVTRVALADRAPLLAPGVGRRAWLADDAMLGGAPDDCRVGPLFPLIPSTPGYADNLRVYESAGEALAALSAACVSLGRALAGLSPLPVVYHAPERNTTSG